MQTVDINLKYVVNPAYKFKEDYLNVIITNNNPGRYDAGRHRDDITSSFAWRTHPDLAYLFSYFDGSRSLDETAALFAEREGVEKERFLESVYPCIGNSDPILIPADDRHWVSIPKNFLIPNPGGLVRDNLLQGIDLPFIQKNYDLAEVRLRVPNSMTLMLNTDCTADCVYCYADRPQIPQPLPFKRIQELLRQAYDLGMPDVDVDGGEFFLYKDWRRLLETMRQYDYVPNISTKHPLTEEIVNDLKRLGIHHIQLSIDSVDNAEIRQMLQVDDAYLGKVLHGLRLLDEAGFDITVKPVITCYNDSEKSLNATIDALTTFENVKWIDFTPANFSQFRPPTYYSTQSQLDRLKTVVEQRNKACKAVLSFAGYEEPTSIEQRQANWERRPMCTGNVQGFFVLPDGKVTLCEQLYWHPFFILGNLTRQSIMEMWNSEKALSLWNISRGEVRGASPCRLCFHFEDCRRGLGNCWRRAVAAYGPENYDFPSPDCPKAPPVAKDFHIP